MKVAVKMIYKKRTLAYPGAGLSLRFQVAGYLLLVAGEVASSHGAPSHPLPLPPRLYVKPRWRVSLVAGKWEYTCKHRAFKKSIG